MRSAGIKDVGVKKPRLLVLASTYPRWRDDHEPGFVHELSRRLIDDFEVTVLCPRSPGARPREELDGVTVIRYRYAIRKMETLVSAGGLVGNLKAHPLKLLLLPSFFLGQLIALGGLLRRLRPDVIHAHWLIPQGLSVCLLQLLLGRNTPLLVTSHGADLFALRGRFFYLAKRFVLSRSNAITVVSRVMKTELKPLGVDEANVTVQPMGVELGEAFKPDQLVTRARNQLLFVGRLVEKKGLQYLLSAMPEIIARYPECELRIVGFGPDEERLKTQVRDLNLLSHVHFEGAVPNRELPAYYRQASVFVAPFVQAENGDQEGLGLVLVEAIGCGCPAVVSNLPAVADVTDGLEGVITVPQKQVRAIVDAVLEVLDDAERFKADAAQASSLIKERFDWDAVAKRYGRILSNLIKEEARR